MNHVIIQRRSEALSDEENQHLLAGDFDSCSSAEADI